MSRSQDGHDTTESARIRALRASIEAMALERESLIRRSRTFAVHVRDLDDGSGKVCMSVIRTEWHPGQGRAADQLTLEWVSEEELEQRLRQLIAEIRRLGKGVPVPGGPPA